jgi:hypothetical protein
VVVGLDEYDKPPEAFGKTQIIVSFKGTDFSLITLNDTLEKSIHYAYALGLQPKTAKVTDRSMTDEAAVALVHSIALEYEKQHQQREKQQHIQQEKEVKKYENKDVKHALKVVNSNIDRIEQLLFIGRGVLS